MPRHVRVPLGRYLPPRGHDFVAVEVLGGLVLAAATVAALTWANVSARSYETLWSTDLTVGVGRFALTEDLQHWVNDGLMTVFFFVVGLEIKRELVRGELRNPRTASLPVIAAIGGMAVPALIFVACNPTAPERSGWAIPMATDIAFAVALLALFGSRVPRGLKLFLLTLAIVDDVGAVVVIALFYSEELAGAWLVGAAGLLVLMVGMQRLGLARPLLYILPAAALWVCALESGIHPTIAGVALGLLTPARPFGGRAVIETLEHRLHPWSSLMIVPLFALANAGIPLSGTRLGNAAQSSVALGVVLGLTLGKPVGILGATALALRLGAGRLPAGVRLAHVLPVGAVAGIGFTVSLFVAELSFTGTALDEAKTAILVASLVSALLAAGLLVAVRRSGSSAA
jgi:NhaA family Na+:H+ antiporter